MPIGLERTDMHQVIGNKLDSADYDEYMMLPAFKKARGEDLPDAMVDVTRLVIRLYRAVLQSFPPRLTEECYDEIRRVEELYEVYFYTVVYGAERISTLVDPTKIR